jgi:hypothetical protein
MPTRPSVRQSDGRAMVRPKSVSGGLDQRKRFTSVNAATANSKIVGVTVASIVVLGRPFLGANAIPEGRVSVGERESGTAKLEEAIATFREALKEQTRERMPLDWAVTQNNLGKALRSYHSRCSCHSAPGAISRYATNSRTAPDPSACPCG